jgi:hypothetical protein
VCYKHGITSGYNLQEQGKESYERLSLVAGEKEEKPLTNQWVNLV